MKLKMHYQWKLRDQLVSNGLTIVEIDRWQEELRRFNDEAMKYMDKEAFYLRIEICSD